MPLRKLATLRGRKSGSPELRSRPGLNLTVSIVLYSMQSVSGGFQGKFSDSRIAWALRLTAQEGGVISMLCQSFRVVASGVPSRACL